jgi:hypothetical protein
MFLSLSFRVVTLKGIFTNLSSRASFDDFRFIMAAAFAREYSLFCPLRDCAALSLEPFSQQEKHSRALSQ